MGENGINTKDFRRAAIVLALLTASLLLNVKHWRKQETSHIVVKDTITYVDTITYYAPAPMEKRETGSVRRHLPVACPQGNTVKEISREAEEKVTSEEDSLPSIPDSVDVSIPITQQVYADSTYRAVISGYSVSLDTMLVFPRHEVVTIRQTSAPKRWGIGIQAGCGVTKNGLQPYIGIGVSYNLIRF